MHLLGFYEPVKFGFKYKHLHFDEIIKYENLYEKNGYHLSKK